MTNTIGDISKAEVILVTGSNTTENHPVISTYIKRAAKFGGAKLIVVDPRRITLTRYAHKWLRQRPGTDVAWINGMIHVIIQEGLYDRKYVEERTEGFEKLRESVKKYTPEYVEDITGIPASDLIEVARLYASGRPSTILYTMGITQHICGTDNVKALANLAMLCGNIGVEGGGLNPLRGQNNVQGACDMGGLPNVYSGYQKVEDQGAREKMQRAWGVDSLPERPGLKATEMIPAALSGNIKALYIIGENPLISDPDTSHVKKALESLDFLVVQDIFLTETARLADVVLPAACFAEKDGTFTNTERRIQRVRKAIEPVGEAMEDWKIIAHLANKMGFEMSYGCAEEIMEEIASVTPSYGGITYERIEEVGLHWPCPTRDHPGTPVLHREGFARGKGLFNVVEYIPPAELPDEEYPLLLSTGRLLYHYHTATMTRKVEGLNDLAPECFVEISPGDAESHGISDGDRIRISSRRGSIEAVARVSLRAIEGTIFIPFHFAEAAANVLTNPALDPVSGIPEYKVCAVKIEGI